MTFEDFSESTDAWYILYDNGHQGPFTFEKILALHQLGEIGAENLLWNSSLTKWEKITEIPELKDLPPTAVTYKSNFSEELVWLKRTPTTWVESYIEDDLSVNTAIVIRIFRCGVNPNHR